MIEHDDQTIPPAEGSRGPYEAPSVTVLGALADLTLGGIAGTVSDGFGTSGDTGSI